MHINDTPETVQPTNAVMATFADRDASAIEQLFADGDISSDRIWMWSGDEGRAAYEDRAAALSRLFDDSDDFVSRSFDAGRALVVVHCVDEDDARAVQALANERGAEETLYFGESTHSL